MGHIYYHHTATNQSTYVRPLPAIPVLSAPVDPKNISGELKEKKKKKEKPAEKVPIPGTEWLKVTTNMGNIFWTHTGRKESVWTVPDEIKDIVEQMRRGEQEKFQQQKEAEMAAAAESRNPKRKPEEREHESRGKVKKPKTNESPKPEPPKSEAPGPETVETQPAEDDDEAWHQQIAEEMAMVEDAQTAPEPAPPRMTKAEAAKQIFDVPAKVDISLEEGKALFRVCFYVFLPLHTDNANRPYCKRRISTPCIPGRNRYHFLLVTHATYFSQTKRQDGKYSTNIVAKRCARNAKVPLQRLPNRHQVPLRIRRRSRWHSKNFCAPPPLPHDSPGMNGEKCIRKTDASLSMGG